MSCVGGKDDVTPRQLGLGAWDSVYRSAAVRDGFVSLAVVVVSFEEVRTVVSPSRVLQWLRQERLPFAKFGAEVLFFAGSSAKKHDDTSPPARAAFQLNAHIEICKDAKKRWKGELPHFSTNAYSGYQLCGVVSENAYMQIYLCIFCRNAKYIIGRRRHVMWIGAPSLRSAITRSFSIAAFLEKLSKSSPSGKSSGHILNTESALAQHQ